MNIYLRSILIFILYPLFFVLSEMGYRYLFGIRPLEQYIETFWINLAFIVFLYFSKCRFTRFCLVFFFGLSQIVNSVHYEVYQNWINATNYYLFFEEFQEVFHNGVSMLDKVIPPFLYSLLETFVFASILFFIPHRKSKKYLSIDLLFYLIFIYMFIRSFYSTQEFGITSNLSYSRIKSNFYTFSVFIGKVIPYNLLHLSKVENYSHPIPDIVSEPKVKNIILIMGESLSATHVNYFGYKRETMPFLTQLAKNNKDNNEVLLKEAYSAGLMTAISVPAFFSAIPYPNGLTQIIKGDTNFFHLAKLQGFETYFYTAQPEKQMMIMSLMGKSWMDHQFTPTDLHHNSSLGMNDHYLFPLFEKINLDQGKHFIVLHQRGSHGVYGEYLSEDEKAFKENTPLDNYDSTIYNTDQLIKKVYDYLKARNKEDYLLIYTSDHGQHVTSSFYNQGTMDESQYLVPVFIYAPEHIFNNTIQKFKQCNRLFHQQIATFIINTMGFNMPISDCKNGIINSGFITGDMGYLKVSYPAPPVFINPNRK
ncbi:sulfatase-like hydrolase/transferase [Avibacterium paragallinarum]|nr:sulfatase-like hydrolase/transferase [Avibacterium paragallinarum]UXN37438.1 sulfatase-like hydrolase/transferase [Avibacterium paragallinarum]